MLLKLHFTQCMHVGNCFWNGFLFRPTDRPNPSGCPWTWEPSDGRRRLLLLLFLFLLLSTHLPHCRLISPFVLSSWRSSFMVVSRRRTSHSFRCKTHFLWISLLCSCRGGNWTRQSRVCSPIVVVFVPPPTTTVVVVVIVSLSRWRSMKYRSGMWAMEVPPLDIFLLV